MEVRIQDIKERYTSLTPRQRQVIDAVLDGKSNKDIAALLGISRRTVEIHRALAMKSLGILGRKGLMRLVGSMLKSAHI
ncbi:MAG: LuxR C-terminal-related transcriptional regulator [Dehalococcoidia bacterium]